MNMWSLWIVAGLLAVLSLGQILWLTVETQTGVAVYGLPDDLCREVAAGGQMSVAEAVRIYTACRDGAGVRSGALRPVGERMPVDPRGGPALQGVPHDVRMGMETAPPSVRLPHAGPSLPRLGLEGAPRRPYLDRHDRHSQVMVTWGLPTRVTRTTKASEVREQQVYEGGVLDGTRFPSFRNGVLTAVETRRV